jgi:hypothetical protein
LKKKNNVGRLTFAYFKTYYKTIVIRQCGIGRRTDIKIDEIEL